MKDAAANLGYKPNRLARGLRTHASGMVGLITEEIAITPYAGRIIQGAQEAAAERGLTLAIINSELNPYPDIDPQAPIPYSLYPELTTVALPHYEMGAWAVETLSALVEGKGEYRLLGAHSTLLTCPIVHRGSVARPPRSA